MTHILTDAAEKNLPARAVDLLEQDSGIPGIAYLEPVGIDSAVMDVSDEYGYCGRIMISDGADLDGTSRSRFAVGVYPSNIHGEVSDHILLDGTVDCWTDQAMLETVKRAIEILERRAISLRAISAAVADVCHGEVSLGDALRAIPNCPFGDESPGMVDGLERAIASYVFNWATGNMTDSELYDFQPNEIR